MARLHTDSTTPDGSWVEMPAQDDDSNALNARAPRVPDHPPDARSSAPENVRQFLRDIGRRGGQSRASRHTRAELAAWGRVRHRN